MDEPTSGLDPAFAVFGLLCTLILIAAGYMLGKVSGPFLWRELGLSIMLFLILASIYLPLHLGLDPKIRDL